MFLSDYNNSYSKDNIRLLSYYLVAVEGNTCTLLPSDHGKYYPIQFEINTQKLLKGTLNFYNQPLFDNAHKQNVISEKQVNYHWKPKVHPKCVVLSIMDNCFGHSLLKMFHVLSFHKKYGDAYDLVIITPKALSHYLPKDKCSIISVDLGFYKAKACFDLAPILATIDGRYPQVEHGLLNTYADHENKADIVSFFNFTIDSILPNSNKKAITYYYRKDLHRTWMGNKQAKNVVSLFTSLKSCFPEVDFHVVGDLDHRQFPNWISDNRTNEFSAALDLEYNTIFNKSILVIGLVGSNMLLPSLFAYKTIHLVPEHKMSVTAEEIINVKGAVIPKWFESIYLFGNQYLSDYSPKKLSRHVKTLFHSGMTKDYKALAFGVDHLKDPIDLKSYLKKEHPYFDFATYYHEAYKSEAKAYYRFNWYYLIFSPNTKFIRSLFKKVISKMQRKNHAV